MHAEVLEVALGYHHAQRVGHAAYAELYRRAVADVGYDVRGYLRVHLAGGAAGQLDGRAVLALDDHVDLGDVDALLLAAVDAGQALEHLYHDDVGVVYVRPRVAGGDGEVEVAVLVHGRGADEGDVYVQEVVVVPAQVAVQHGLVVAQAAVGELALVAREMPGVIGEVLLLRVGFDGADGAVAEHPAYFDVRELLAPLGEGGVAEAGEGDARAVFDPVPALYERGGLGGGAQLALIFAHIVHV